MKRHENSNLAELECAGSNKQRHFLINPTLLQCGHFSCVSCVWNEKSVNETVRCRICGEEKTVNTKMNPASYLMGQQIKTHLDKLFEVVHEKCNFALAEFGKSFKDKKESVEIKFQYLKEEVELRAESLKIEIDELCEKIYKDLQVHKDETLKQIDASYVDGSNYKKNLDSMNDLTLIEKTTDNLAYLQNNLNSLNFFIRKIEEHTKSVEVTPTKQSIDLEHLIYVNYLNKNSKNLIIPEEFKQKVHINVRDFSFNDLYVLTNDQLLVTDAINKCITIYDKKLKFVNKSKLKVPNSEKNLIPFGVSTNRRDRIYVSGDKFVLMTDFAFNLLRYIEMQNPKGLCFSNNLLYVCDMDAYRIYKLKADLTYETSFSLDYTPLYIQIINNIACIRHCAELISFYTLPEFNLKYRYRGHNGFVCTFDSNFYEFYQPTSTFYCYNSDGTICDKKNTNLLQCDETSIRDPICYFGGKFVLVSNTFNAFIIP